MLENEMQQMTILFAGELKNLRKHRNSFDWIAGTVEDETNAIEVLEDNNTREGICVAVTSIKIRRFRVLRVFLSSLREVETLICEETLEEVGRASTRSAYKNLNWVGSAQL